MKINWFHLSAYKLGFIGGLLLLVLCLGFPTKASAAYVEGNLIDDTMFLDAASMSEAQIQSFLTARGGYLATYNSWSDRDGANVSAARIIAEAAYDYGISPKVILATLQKEQSLVTAKNPTASQLNFAMGYGCPDSTGCGTAYKGFYQQVDNGTWQLRYNFERARGNNTWWRNSSSYACGGSTRYYSPGLYRGNTVTFYDDAGVAYKTFKLLGAAAASLYCYTPHAYPGSAGQYYSGSYNFVVAYENWFGSTQPGVVVTSPLRIQTASGGNFTNTPVTASFDMRNNLNWDVYVGKMVVAARDPLGNNVDFAFTGIVVPANSTYTYTSTQTFTVEGEYNFWISNFFEEQWSNTSPPSTDIDNARGFKSTFRAMPTITQAPALTTAARQGQPMQMSFKVKNNSSQSMAMGKMAIAIRGPQDQNVGMALHDITLPAGGEYTYVDSTVPPVIGVYRTFITSTRDNGITWNTSTFPGVESGVSRSKEVEVKPNPTITVQPSVTGALRANDTATAGFTLHNFGSTPAKVGYIAVAVRGPNGENIGGPLRDVTVPAGQDYVYSEPIKTVGPGTYTAWITSTTDGNKWNDTTYPATESNSIQRKITFVVKPNPTVTVQPAVSDAPRAYMPTTVTFTMHNYTGQPVHAGKVAIAARGPNGENVGGPLRDVTIPAGQDYVYNEAITPVGPGTYTAWITSTPDDGRTWNNTTYPAMESSSMLRKITFEVKPNPTITVQPSVTGALRANDTATAGFTLHNFGSTPAKVGYIAVAVRGPNGENIGGPLRDVTVPAGQDYVYSEPIKTVGPGTYTAWITSTTDGNKWNDTTYPATESNSIQRKITFVVKPNPTVTVQPAVSGTLKTFSPITVSFTLHNFGSNPANVGKVAVAVRGPNGENIGGPLRDVTVPAGQDYIYSEPITTVGPGTYTAWITSTPDDGRTWNNTTYPAMESSSVLRKITFEVLP